MAFSIISPVLSLVCGLPDTPTPIKVSVLSEEVTEISKTAALPVFQLVNKRLAGWVWLWSELGSYLCTKMSSMVCFG